MTKTEFVARVSRLRPPPPEKKKPDGKNLPGTQAIVCAISWLFAFLSIRGWFYKDRFIGSEPNEKLKKKLKKKPKVIEEDAPPLPPPASLLL